MNLSFAKYLGSVPFPSWTGERVYMRPFTKSVGLPTHLSRWQPTVDAMLKSVNVDGPIYLMIDQGEIMAGKSHRRAGAHIDGYWIPGIDRHGGHRTSAGDWRNDDRGRWKNGGFSEPEALILASNVGASRALLGTWDGRIGEGGDCMGADLSRLTPHMLEANRAYAGNVTMVHESLPVSEDCQRTLVRLNVPGWSPERR